MDSFEFNKIAGAILGTLMLTMALGLFSGYVVAPSPVGKPGYDLPSAPAEEGPAAAAAPAEPLPVLLAKADPHKGEADMKVCQACHNLEKGAGAKIGPPLYGVVGRQVASVAGFDYSDSMKKKGGTWTLEDINQFITNPKGYVPGTKMGFAGEDSPTKRADILDYLNTLSDNPQPLPKPEPAAATGQQPSAQPATGSGTQTNPGHAPANPTPVEPAHPQQPSPPTSPTTTP